MKPRLLAIAALFFIPLQAGAAPVVFDNGAPQAIGFPNAPQIGSFNGTNYLDDFFFAEDVIVKEIQFSVFARTLRNFSPQFRIFEELPTAGNAQEYQSGISISNRPSTATPNGLTINNAPPLPGFDILVSDLNIPLSAGSYVLNWSIGIGISDVHVGYNAGGGPSTFSNPDNMPLLRRIGTGQSTSQIVGGNAEGAFKISAVSQVPIPAPMLLLIGALVGLAAVRRIGQA